MQCFQCKKEYKSKRADSKYCSGACRIQSHRGATKDVTDKIAVTKKFDVTDKSAILVTDKLSTCSEVPHIASCLQCEHFKKEEKIKKDENCGEKYFDCKTRRICVENYHQEFCA